MYRAISTRYTLVHLEVAGSSDKRCRRGYHVPVGLRLAQSASKSENKTS